MDCESFERVVLDRLFLELDELSMGAAQRHVAHCSRCRGIEAGLKATREVCRLPLVALPNEFAEHLISLERQMHAILPLRQRASRAISVLAGYAMRPQPTMAVLLLLMIGASLFLVRSRPPERDLVQVTERGVPEGEVDGLQAQMRPSSLPTDTRNVPDVTASSNAGTVASRPIAGQNENCSQTDAIGCASSGLKRAGVFTRPAPKQSELESELEAARQVRKASGCHRAIPAFESIRLHQPNSDVGYAAAWEAAECYAKLDRKDEARSLLNGLVASPLYAKRAESLLKLLKNP